MFSSFFIMFPFGKHQRCALLIFTYAWANTSKATTKRNRSNWMSLHDKVVHITYHFLSLFPCVRVLFLSFSRSLSPCLSLSLSQVCVFTKPMCVCILFFRLNLMKKKGLFAFQVPINRRHCDQNNSYLSIEMRQCVS